MTEYPDAICPAICPSQGEPRRCALRVAALLPCLLSFLAGCGTTKSFEATEQLLLSDAVDESVSAIDFRPLSGQRVFLDTEYLRAVKNNHFVNAEYVISSLRQQIMGAGCLLQDNKEEADLIIEPRVGTLGSDAFQVTYGIPPSTGLASVAQVVPTAPPVPIIPELSVARRESREGAAKVAAFAYDRLTRLPVWQSGMSRTNTTARDTWIFGIGPIQTGSVRSTTRVVGADMEFGTTTVEGGTPRNLYDRPPVNYNAEVRFENGVPILGPRIPSDGMLPEGTPGSVPAPGAGAPETAPRPLFPESPPSGSSGPGTEIIPGGGGGNLLPPQTGAIAPQPGAQGQGEVILPPLPNPR